MEAYALLACFILLIGFLCMVAVALVLGERVMHLEQTAERRHRERLAMVKKVGDLNIELTKAHNKLQAFKPFDRDGDGYPGGRKPNIDSYVKRALDRANVSPSRTSGERPAQTS